MGHLRRKQLLLERGRGLGKGGGVCHLWEGHQWRLVVGAAGTRQEHCRREKDRKRCHVNNKHLDAD